MNLQAIVKSKSRAHRACASVVLLATLLVCVTATAQTDPFTDFHIFDPVRGVKGSFITSVKPDVGPIDYLEKASPAIARHLKVRVKGWLYSPKMASSNTASMSIIYTVIKYPSEAMARDVIDAVFGVPFIKAFKAHTDEYNRNQRDLVQRETRNSRAQHTRFLVRSNYAAYPPGKKWTMTGYSHYFFSYEFNGPARPCSQRQVIKQTEHMYVYKTHYWVTGTRESGLYVNSYTEGTDDKIVSGQSYYRLIRSGAYILVIRVSAQSKTLDPQTNKYIGTPHPPDLLARYWNIVETESRHFVCRKSVASNIVITLSMPRTGELTACRGTVFGPAFPDFKTVHLTGKVTYESLMDEGDVCGAELTARIINKGKVVVQKKVKTDAYGWYELTLPVNRKGTRRVKEIRRDIIRRLSGYLLPSDTYCKKKRKRKTSGSGQRIKPLDWKHCFWDRSSALNAMWKDIQYQKHGGKGSPNLDTWRKNHDHGRDIANALQLLIDVATSPATASAQMIENANITWKWLTGKSRPLVKPGTKNSADIMKKISGLYQHNQDLRNAGAIE